MMQTLELRSDRVLPPANEEVEIAVLGILLLQSSLMPLVENRLKPHLFSLQGHQTICEALLSLYAGQQAIDMLSVVNWLKGKNKLDQAGGRGAILTIFESFNIPANLSSYVDLLEEKWQRREAIRIADQLMRAAHSSDAVDSVLQSAIAQLSDLSVPDGSGAVHVSKITEDCFVQIEQNSQRDGMLGTPTEFYDLDAMIKGLQDGILFILAARPAMGKTAAMVAMAIAVAKSGKPVVIFSIEMSKEQLWFRIVSALAGIESSRIKAGALGNEDLNQFQQWSEYLDKLPIFIKDGAVTADEIYCRSREVQLSTGGELGGVFIDYLQLMQGDGNNRVEALSRITRQLKIDAGKGNESRPGLNCPVVLLSQLNRGVESRTNKRPMMSDLRESGAIEQDADIVLGLYRDEYYNQDSPDRGIAEFILLKHREGPVGTVKLLFEPHYTRFKNLVRPGGGYDY